MSEGLYSILLTVKVVDTISAKEIHCLYPSSMVQLLLRFDSSAVCGNDELAVCPGYC